MGGGWRGYAARLFLLFSFPCSADHKRDWPPCKVVFRVGNQYAECEKQCKDSVVEYGVCGSVSEFDIAGTGAVYIISV